MTGLHRQDPGRRRGYGDGYTDAINRLRRVLSTALDDAAFDAIADLETRRAAHLAHPLEIGVDALAVMVEDSIAGRPVDDYARVLVDADPTAAAEALSCAAILLAKHALGGEHSDFDTDPPEVF